MDQIADIDGFNIMNNLRLVIIGAIFVGIIFVLLLSKIVGTRRKIKRKYMQEVNPYDDSNREERHTPDAEDDFFGMEESVEKEKSKGGASTAESEVETGGKPVVNNIRVETDLNAAIVEVTKKIERLVLKVDTIEKGVLNKIEEVIDEKIQDASNKINDRITEVLGTKKDSITSVSEKQVNSLREGEVPADILPSGDATVPDEITEKEQTETIALSGKAEEKISEGDVGESADFDIQELLGEESAGMTSIEETEKLVEEKVKFEGKKEGDLEAPVEDGDILEKLAGSLETDEEPVGILPSDESKVVAEENVLPEKIKEKELEAPPEAKEEIKAEKEESIDAVDSSGEVEGNILEEAVGESADFDIEKLLDEEPVGISPFDESKEAVEKKVEAGKPAEAVIPSEENGEKELDTVKDEKAEEKKKSTEESVDFDIQEFLEELGSPPSEKDLKSEKG